MPTYQTTPYISWTFPDQAISMNRKGVQPLKATTLPRQDMIVGSAQYGWAEDARKMVLAGLETNRVKDEGMRGLRNTTARSQAHDRPSTLSQTRINGKFEHPSYQYTQTPSGMRGGTGLLTKEGRAWAKRRLQQRIGELNAIESQDYSAGPPTKITILPGTVEADQALARLYNYISSAATTNPALPDIANKLIVALLRAAPSMDGRKLSQYDSDINHILTLVRNNLIGMDEAEANPEDYYIQYAVKKELERAKDVVKQIANIQRQAIPDRVKEQNFRALADEVLRTGVPPVKEKPRNPLVDESYWEGEGEEEEA